MALNRIRETRDVARQFLQELSAEDYGLDITLTIVEVIALVIALSGNARCGAQLAAYAEASYNRSTHLRSAIHKSPRERLEAVLRERLESTERSTLDATGASLSPKDAIALAQAALDEMPAENYQLIE